MSHESIFLRILDLMTGEPAQQDGYRWVIKSIDMLPEGPCAMFYFDWHSPRAGTVGTSSHDSFACMSMRMENSKPVLWGETCTMGRQTTDATQALFNRFTRALQVVKP